MPMEKERVAVLLTKPFLDGLDRLVQEGIYLERQAAIRDAVRFLMRRHGIPPFYLEAKVDEYAVRAP